MSPSTHQDSPKVPWPTMELVRPEGADLVQPWLPQIGENDLTGYEVETYIPVSALLSDQAKRAGRLALQEAAAQQPETWANAVLEAAVDAVTGGNGE